MTSAAYIGESCLQYVRGNCFFSCINLKTVKFPKSIVLINTTAFQGCTSLCLVSIQDGCTSYVTESDGSILSADFTSLIFVSPYSTSLHLKKETKKIASSIIQKLTKVPIENVTIDPGNQYIKFKGGIFYNSDFSMAENALGSVEDVVIDARTVTLQISLFSGIKSLRRVTFAEGSKCKSILQNCFSFTENLESVELPDSVYEIKERTFESSGIQSFTIPASLGNIVEYVFLNCIHLKRLNCSSNCVLKSMSTMCFYNTSLTSVLLSNRLESIGISCFAVSNITEIEFPSSLKHIQSSAFSDVPLTKITFNGENLNIISALAFTGALIKEIHFPRSLLTIESGAFSKCALLEVVEFESGCNLNELPTSVFEGCILLKKFPIIPSIYRVDASSFLGCFNLTEFVIEDPQSNHFVFRENGLYDSSGKALYVFPPGLSAGKVISDAFEIKENAFYGDSLLENLTFDEGSKVETFGKDTFFQCTSITSLILPASLKNISDGCFKSCTGLAEVIFRDDSNLQRIGASTFEGCKELIKIEFGKKSELKSIGESTFWRCSKLRSIKFPSKIEFIGNSAFNECSQLTSIEFDQPTNAIAIPNSCFAKCTKLFSLLIPPYIKSIGSDAFSDCTSLHYLNISEGVKKIGDRAFMGCGLPFADLPSSLNEVGVRAFSMNGNLRVAVIRCQMGLKLGSHCFASCSRLINISFCAENEVEADETIFKGSRMVLVYTLKMYPTEKVGGEHAHKVMDYCMIFPSAPFTIQKLSNYQYGLLSAAIVDTE